MAKATSGVSSLWHTYLNWRYAILFYSLLFTLAEVPLRRTLGFPTSLLELFLAINLLAAVVPIGARKTRRILLPCLVVGLVGRGGVGLVDQGDISTVRVARYGRGRRLER